MKRILTYLFLLVSVTTVSAQNTAKADAHYSGQTTVIRIDGSAPNSWLKGDNDGAAANTTPVTGNENVNFSSTAEGVFINILNGTNKIKLFALTGQLLSSGDLNQGRWFIPTRKGIYFLKINNKSYKVICK
jgi:hypothetical protein